MSFEDDVKRISASSATGRLFLNAVAESAKEVDKIIEKVIYEFCFRVIQRTPVGAPEQWGNKWRKLRGVDEGRYKPGHLRFNWHFTVGTPARNNQQGEDPTGNTALGRVAARIKTNRKGDRTYWLMNTAPYAYDIEYGYSPQARAGMLRVTIAEWDSIVAKYAGGK